MDRTWWGQAALVGAVLLPLIGSTAAAVRRWSGTCVPLSWAAAAAAGALAVVVAAAGPVVVGTGTGPGLAADPVAAVALVLVTGLGAVVQSFSRRYLYSDPVRDRFASRVGVVVTSMAVVAASADLAGTVVGWLVAGAAFTSLLRCRLDLPGAAECVRATRRALAVGDGCLVVAAALVLWRVGDVRLGSPHALTVAARHLGWWHGPVAALLVTAAMARCAQGPFRRWLPLTVSAPTPASALLHAGVVNGGGLLLVRLGGLGAWAPASVVLLAVAGVTAVWAGLVSRHRADVKGQLAFSTMAQMGFMLAECAVGAYPAAVVHLVGHGCYKASLFLSSGSAVNRPGRTAAPTVTRLRPAPVTALVAAAAASAAVPGVLQGDGVVLAALAAVTAASAVAALGPPAIRAGLGGRSGPVAVTAAAAAASAAYGGVVAAVGGFVEPAASAATGVGPIWLIGVAGAAAAASWVAVSTRWAPALRSRLLDSGWEAVPAPRPATVRPLPGRDPGNGIPGDGPTGRPLETSAA